MNLVAKPQRLYVQWLKGFFRWQERRAVIEWSADDVISLHEVVQDGGADRPLFSIPARDLVRATFTIGFMRLFLPDGRSFHVGLAAAIPADLDGEDVGAYRQRVKARGVADQAWWQRELEAAGVPVKVRAGKWFAGVVIGTTVAIVAGATLLVLVVGT